MSPPDDLDRLSHAELKGWLSGSGSRSSNCSEWWRLCAMRLLGSGWAGSAEPQAERHGAGDRATGKLQQAEAPEGQHAVEAYDRRGADRQGRCAAARLTLQRLQEFRGAGSGGPCACGEFPPRTLADSGW